jgi:hypothetical protein
MLQQRFDTVRLYGPPSSMHGGQGNVTSACTLSADSIMTQSTIRLLSMHVSRHVRFRLQLKVRRLLGGVLQGGAHAAAVAGGGER